MKTLNINAILQLMGLVIVAMAIIIASFLGAFKARTAEGSVTQGSDYGKINFAVSSVYGASTTAGILKGGYGSLGSVVITGSVAGTLNFYDATTTNVTLRATAQSTSSILIASLPSSLVAGTYVFDIAFGRGLIVDLIGSFPTSTVTFR